MGRVRTILAAAMAMLLVLVLPAVAQDGEYEGPADQQFLRIAFDKDWTGDPVDEDAAQVTFLLSIDGQEPEELEPGEYSTEFGWEASYEVEEVVAYLPDGCTFEYAGDTGTDTVDGNVVSRTYQITNVVECDDTGGGTDDTASTTDGDPADDAGEIVQPTEVASGTGGQAAGMPVALVLAMLAGLALLTGGTAVAVRERARRR